MASPLPSTPQSAPPNFYSQVGQIGAGGGGSATQPAAPAAAGAAPDADQEFLSAMTKLMTVLKNLGEMKPRGQDISKYMDAMSQTAKQCLESVFGGSDQSQTPGADNSSEASSSQAPPASGGQPGANAGAPAVP